MFGFEFVEDILWYLESSVLSFVQLFLMFAQFVYGHLQVILNHRFHIF